MLDGGHRISALRAWMEDDYGDKAISTDFYKGQEISEEQKRMAKRTRTLDELYRLLAAEIPSEEDRAKFMASRRST